MWELLFCIVLVYGFVMFFGGGGLTGDDKDNKNK